VVLDGAIALLDEALDSALEDSLVAESLELPLEQAATPKTAKAASPAAATDVR
jgi:hypothetical protein